MGTMHATVNGKTNISHQSRNNTGLLAGAGFPSVGGDFLLRTESWKFFLRYHLDPGRLPGSGMGKSKPGG